MYTFHETYLRRIFFTRINGDNINKGNNRYKNPSSFVKGNRLQNIVKGINRSSSSENTGQGKGPIRE